MIGQTAVTIAAAKADAPESLWHFLGQIPATMEAQQLYALLISGMVGIAAHYLNKWATGQIEGNLWDYLFHDHARSTVLSIGAYIGFALTTVTSGALDGTGWFTALWMGATTGFAVDAIANKGTRPVWTQEQKTAAAVVAANEPPKTVVQPTTEVKP